MKRKTIAIDIDDVLAAQAEGLIAFSNERWGHSLTLDDYTEKFAVMWDVSIPEALRRVDEMLKSEVHSRYQPYKHAVPVLKRLAKRYDLVAITSRRKSVKTETDNWIKRHFPGIFKEVAYAGIWDAGHHPDHAFTLSKAEACRKLGADYLIDDQLKHCQGAAEVGTQAILFGDYPWNRHVELPQGVVRARTWDEVEELFDAQG